MPDTAPVVLLAGTHEAIVTAKSALGPLFAYRTAANVHDAMSQLLPDIDVIVCNVAFDESRMFDFIQAARSSQWERIIPIICLRQRVLTKPTHDAIELSLHAFERVSFIDLYALNQERGAAYALSALRQAVLDEISAQVGAPATSQPVLPGL